MTAAFAKGHGMKYKKCHALDIFKLFDLSGRRIDIVGHIDLQLNTVSGEEYQWTRILIRKGEQKDFIVGRSDLRHLHIIGQNFPMKMSEASATLERRARATTLIEMDDAEDMETEPQHQPAEEGEEEVRVITCEEADVEMAEEAAPFNYHWQSPFNHHWHEEKIVWDQAAELNAEEEFRGMTKERQHGLLLWPLGNGPHDGSATPSIYRGNENKKMRDAEMEKRKDHEEMRKRLIFYGGHLILYIRRVMSFSTAETVDWVAREIERMENFPYSTDDEIWDSMIGSKAFCCRAQELENPGMKCQVCRSGPATAKTAENPLIGKVPKNPLTEKTSENPPIVKALVDTGSTRSFIAKELTEKVVSAEGRAELELETAAGQSGETPGQPDTRLVKLTFAPPTVKELKTSIESREESILEKINALKLVHLSDGRKRVDRAEKRLDLVDSREREQGHFRRARHEPAERAFEHVDRDLGRSRHHDTDDGRSLQVAATKRLLQQEEAGEDDMPGLQSSDDGDGTNEEPSDPSTDGDDGADSEGEGGDNPVGEILFIDDVEILADTSAIQKGERAGETVGKRAGHFGGGGTDEKEAGGRVRERVGRALASSYF